jgi:hypothetical protein
MSLLYQVVKDEHEHALATLTPEQRWALGRIQRAEQLTNFNHRSFGENLTMVIEAEAERRTCAGEA